MRGCNCGLLPTQILVWPEHPGRGGDVHGCCLVISHQKRTKLLNLD
jgi:hypothetical protein